VTDRGGGCTCIVVGNDGGGGKEMVARYFSFALHRIMLKQRTQTLTNKLIILLSSKCSKTAL